MLMEFTYRFEAAHRFLKSDSVQCMTPHGHTWFATLGAKFINHKLNSSQMTVEFGEIKKQWKALIQNTFDHSYMHNINDPIVEVLGQGEHTPRLIPFPGDPTTELISLFLFNKMEIIFKQSEFADRVSLQFIKLQETPTNSILCDREFYSQEISNFKSWTGWWNSEAIEDRAIHGTD